MINAAIDSELLEIKTFYEEAFQLFDSRGKYPVVELSYYPYTNINHTIRVRNGKVLVRISDIFASAPNCIHRALAFILVSKLLNKTVPVKARKIYREFVNSKEIQNKVLQNKRRKGRKHTTTAIGEWFNLDDVFGKLNLVYFQNEITKPTMSWSRKRTYRRLGHYDPAHRTIVISRSLDDKDIPRFVVEYIVYHEMLHIKHPTKHRNGRRYNHTPEFKRDEENFAYFEEAEDWIDENAAYLRKRARKRKWWF